MRIRNALDLGHYVRDRRKAAGLSQAALATKSGVSRRWLSDLEAGKATVEVGLVFHVIAALDLFVDVQAEPDTDFDLDAYLDNIGGRR